MRPGAVASARAFARALLSGAFVAAATLCIHARGDTSILPLVVTLPLVLAASLIMGLPLAALLKRTWREGERAHMACGAVAGRPWRSTAWEPRSPTIG